MTKRDVWKVCALDCSEEWMKCNQCRKLSKTKYLTIGDYVDKLFVVICYKCWMKL